MQKETASWEDRLAKYISIFTSPYITTPVFGLWIIGVYSPSLKTFFLWGLTFFICILVLPSLYVYAQVRAGSITDMHVAIREQRSKPFLVGILCSVMLVGIYYIEHVPEILMILGFLLFINACIFLVVSLFSKVSIHVATYVGSVFILYRLLDHPSILFFLLLFPLIVWARRKRERHTLWQSLSAAVMVMIIIFITLNFFGF